jgi:hypothetical protein
MSMLHVHVACPSCMSMVHVHIACPFCMTMLYVHVNAATPRQWCMSMSMQHVQSMLHVHVTAASPYDAACPCRCYMSMLMSHVCFDAACPSCCMPMSVLYAYICAACPCLWCISMSMLHVHVSVHVNVRAASPCPYCMFMLMQGCMSVSSWSMSISSPFRMPMLQVPHDACPCQCCQSMSMLQVHSACPCYKVFKFAKIQSKKCHENVYFKFKRYLGQKL